MRHDAITRLLTFACDLRFMLLCGLVLLFGCAPTPLAAPVEFQGRLYTDTGIRIGPGETLTIYPDGTMEKAARADLEVGGPASLETGAPGGSP